MKHPLARMRLVALASLALAGLGAGAGCSSSEGFGNLLAGQPCDAFTIHTDPRCACCSKSPGVCTSGVTECAPEGASPTCGDPCPSGLACVEVNGKHVCGTESKCDGEPRQACGACGVSTRTCENGTWSAWSECTGQGECSPGAVEGCGTGKTRTCDGTCHFGECVSECSPGQTDTVSCGNCGTSTRTCDANGVWGQYSACSGEGACSPGSVTSCNGGTQACDASCQYGPCLECQPGRTDTIQCATCQTQTRTCDSNGRWGAYGECVDSGACRPGDTRSCAGGQQTCTSSCEWSSCVPFECQPGTPLVTSCGLCGTQTTPCNADGTYGTPGGCESQGVCTPGATQLCGTNGIQVCDQACAWESCLPIECTSGDSETEACGLCGTRSRSCENGRWTAFSACADAGVCSPNAKQSCGNGGTQTCGKSCQWGQCLGQTCDGSFVQSCGVCGIQTRTCQNGVWSPFSACTGERDCIPGTTRTCNGDSGTQACNFQCFWDACQ
ncbi:MAG TPA: hypothetical protein VHE30_18225 [Polyangiaceae bacterium]|nr:hypothetical protein [Polyangiaceae bacterium]